MSTICSFYANIFKLNILFDDLLSNKMIFDQNVLCFGMHQKFFGDTNGNGFFIEDGNRLIKLKLKIFQGFLHPENLSITSFCRDVLCFHYG